MTEAAAEAYIHGICFKTGPPRRVGAELEWLTYDTRNPARYIEPERLAGAVADAGPLRLASALSCEPGGQLELSSRPAGSLASCVKEIAADLAALRGVLEAHDISISGLGHDPWRPPRRILDVPRYAAMETYFDRSGPAGRFMMCSTASVQVCLDAGTDSAGPGGAAARFRLAHLLGPVLVAAFANSPLSAGRPSGWRSTRQAVWARLDAGRTTAPAPDPDPRAAWTRYALDAPLLCIRRDDGQPWTAPARLTFRDWIRGACATEGPPTLDDLRYHLTTLFPPVRPQGHLELRMIDAQPGDDGWIVPLAVVSALFDDPVANGAATEAALRLGTDGAGAPRSPLWLRGARHGLADRALHRAALDCFGAAREALPRLGAPTHIQEAVGDFAERHVARGRCPADDLLDGVEAAGSFATASAAAAAPLYATGPNATGPNATGPNAAPRHTAPPHKEESP